jgi:hypothetical protein
VTTMRSRKLGESAGRPLLGYGSLRGGSLTT